MTALRHQQDENRKLAKDKEAGDKRIRLLEGEVNKMSQQAESLKGRIKEVTFLKILKSQSDSPLSFQFRGNANSEHLSKVSQEILQRGDIYLSEFRLLLSWYDKGPSD